MIFAPHSYQCQKCLHLFTISSESFTGEPFIKCEKMKCDGLAERVDYSYLSNKDKVEKLCEERKKKPVTQELTCCSRVSKLESEVETLKFAVRCQLEATALDAVSKVER